MDDECQVLNTDENRSAAPKTDDDDPLVAEVKHLLLPLIDSVRLFNDSLD